MDRSQEIIRTSWIGIASDLCISPKYLTAICKKQSGKFRHDADAAKRTVTYHIKRFNI
jgi:hypothetical protein